MNWFQQGVILFLFLIKCGARKYISFIASEMYYLFFKQKGLFSLFARQNYNEREGKTERSSICLFTPPMASIAGTKLGQSHWRSFIQISYAGRGAQGLGPPSAASPEWSWVRSGAVRLQLVHTWNTGTARFGLTHYVTTLAPSFFL